MFRSCWVRDLWQLLLLYQGSSLRRLISQRLGEARHSCILTPRDHCTVKKLVGFNVSFRTVHWTRRGHDSLTVGVCFYLVERSRSAGRKEPLRACSEQTVTSRFEAGGVHCIISSTKFTQEPQHMHHRQGRSLA